MKTITDFIDKPKEERIHSGADYCAGYGAYDGSGYVFDAGSGYGSGDGTGYGTGNI